MERMEEFIVSLYKKLHRTAGLTGPVPKGPFLRMTYEEAMSRHGVDKPDLRIKGLVSLFFLRCTAQTNDIDPPH
jgi:aspartyl-tRNA synthetase